MKIIIGDTYEKLSEQAADNVIQMMQTREQPLICTASGDSPAGLYKKLVDRVNNNRLNISEWWFVGLDEWTGMNGNDDGSCRYHLNQQLFGRIGVNEERICFFDGRSADGEAECDRVENFIEERGGIDVAILGLGMNGHIGMNEPGTSKNSRSHVTDLDTTTQQVGQKYFKKSQSLTTGITLGIATIMDARNLVLVVSGKHKAPIVQKIVEHEISENLPGSLLRAHPSLYIYLDADAASGLIHM